jgi:two-component system, OmpR family, response regulator
VGSTVMSGQGKARKALDDSAEARGAVQPTDRLEVGPILLNRATRTVSLAGRRIGLTGAEFDVLELILERHPKIVSAADLASLALRSHAGDLALLIRVHVCHLRHAFGDHKALIATVRGHGYRIALEPLDD